jgi:hypothetical protein
MKNMKLKRILGISSIMLVGLGISIPIALTTSCSGSVDLTFTSRTDFNKYFEDHHDEYDAPLSSSSDSATIINYFITSHRLSAANMLYSGMSEMAIPDLLAEASNDNPLKLKINVGDFDARFEFAKDFYEETDDAKQTHKKGSFYELSINDKVIASHFKVIFSLTGKNYSLEYTTDQNESILNNGDLSATCMIDSSDDSYFFLKFSNYLDLIIFTLPKA